MGSPSRWYEAEHRRSNGVFSIDFFLFLCWGTRAQRTLTHHGHGAAQHGKHATAMGEGAAEKNRATQYNVEKENVAELIAYNALTKTRAPRLRRPRGYDG